MQLLHYRDISFSGQSALQARDLYEKVAPSLMARYSPHDPELISAIRPIVTFSLLTLLCANDGDLTKKRILDLGCGSRKGPEYAVIDHSRRFEPWLCRTLYELGVPVVGIDMGDLSSEPFEHYVCDLMQPSALKHFPEASFDSVHACQLFDSPALFRRYGDNAGSRIRETLIPQARRVAKPNTIFLYLD